MNNNFLSGTQKAVIAIGLAVIMLKKRSSKDNKNDDVIEKNESQESNVEVIQTLEAICKNFPFQFSQRADEIISPIIYFDVAFFLWNCESKADNSYPKNIIVCLETSLLSKETNSDPRSIIQFKDHVITKTTKRLFHKDLSSFHNMLSIYWEFISNETKLGIMFLEILFESIGKICQLNTVPDYLSDDDIHKRLFMFCKLLRSCVLLKLSADCPEEKKIKFQVKTTIKHYAYR